MFCSAVQTLLYGHYFHPGSNSALRWLFRFYSRSQSTISSLSTSRRLSALSPRFCFVVNAQSYQTLLVVTMEVHSVDQLFFFFFFQIAFSQHNSIMDLVQFFVTFFRWVTCLLSQDLNAQLSGNPPHLPNSKPSGPYYGLLKYLVLFFF